MAYPRFQLARAHKKYRYTGGTLTLNSTSWANLPTVGTAGDLVLAAQVGDTIEGVISCLLNDEAVEAHLDVWTIVSGSAVNQFGGAQGGTSWWGRSSNVFKANGPEHYVIQAGDLAADGTVTFRMRYKTSAASNKSLLSSTNLPLSFFVRNLGPADPN